MLLSCNILYHFNRNKSKLKKGWREIDHLIAQSYEGIGREYVA